jgi:ankyrin repeat protein
VRFDVRSFSRPFVVSLRCAASAMFACAFLASPALALTKSELNAALATAVSKGDVAMTEMLLNQGADANACYVGCTRTAFDQALDDRDVPMMRALAKHGANPNLMPTADGTAPGWTVMVPSFEAMHALGHPVLKEDPVRDAFVALGGNLNLRDGGGNTWLMTMPFIAVQTAPAKDTLAFLAAHGFDFDARNKKGETAIIRYAMQPCTRDGANVVALIRSHGGDASLKDASGHSASDYAILSDCAPMLAALGH